MPNLLLCGLGDAGSRIKAALEEEGWTVTGIRRQAAGDVIGFDDAASVRAAIAGATNILSSVPPAEGADPVLALYGGDLRQAPARGVGYMYETGASGDTGGAYVEEIPHLGGGRRTERAATDMAGGDVTNVG